MSHRVQYRRDTKERWEEINPILLEGEVGFETDTHHQKIGDGVHAWNDLEYEIGIGNITQELGNSENLAISQKIFSDKFNKLINKIQEIAVDITELSTALAEGTFNVAISELANSVKNGAITFNSLDGPLRLSNTIIDNLNTENTLMPLSANQGVVLKNLIDALSRKTVYLTKEQYKDLEANGEIISDVEYNILEDE